MSKDNVAIHYNMGEFLRRIESQPASFGHPTSDTSFCGAASVAECVAYVRRGATEREQKPARDLLALIDTKTRGTSKRVWEAGPAGGVVCVPDYLTGLPNYMRRKVKKTSPVAPIRLVCETLVSQGVTTAQLVRRGAALAALAMRLSETRPVELWAAWSMQMHGRQTDSALSGEVTGRVKLDVNPVNLSECVAVFGSKQFMRGITFAEGHGQSKREYGGISWGWNMNPHKAGRDAKVRDALGLNPQDIFIPGGHISESDAFMRDPVAWVNKYLDPQRKDDAR